MKSSKQRRRCVGPLLVAVTVGLSMLPWVYGAADALRIVDDAQIQRELREQGRAMVSASGARFADKAEAQLARRTCQLDLPQAVAADALSPAEIYNTRLASVVVVGVFYHCASPTCSRLHHSAASGVLIREDGIFVTNYHVVDRENGTVQGIVVQTVDGQRFLAEEILAADPVGDVAILSLQDAQGLAAAPIQADEPVGRPVTVISHPRDSFFTLTTGHVSRYSRGDQQKVVLNITADYAVGSSGGAIFNAQGALVGLVSSTTSIAARKSRFTVDPETGYLGVLHRRQRLAGEEEQPMQAPDTDEPDDGQAQEEQEAPEEQEDRGEPDDTRARRQVVDLPMHHQMTIKNAVPARAILALCEAPHE